jgi:glycosyltransferase involved in cell wall biosynthesis
MTDKTLRELYAEHTGKVSDKWSLYLREYDRLFTQFRDRPVRMLEIGIQNGGSLEIWAKYFADAAAFVGCDINPDCAKLSYDDPRIHVIVGDANLPETMAEVLDVSAAFDIIIDDGSHHSGDIVKSFALYFPSLAEGGVFVAEDLHCSYWGPYQGGLFDPYASMTFFKRLADVINHEHWGIARPRADLLRGIFDHYECVVEAEVLAQIHSVEFVNSMCVIRKSPPAENGLGFRMVAGTEEPVIAGLREVNNSPYKATLAFNESLNPWSQRLAPPEETIETTELGLSQREAVLTEALGALRTVNLSLQQARTLHAATQETLHNTVTALEQAKAALAESQEALAQTNAAFGQKQTALEETDRALREMTQARLNAEEGWRDTARTVERLIRELTEIRNSKSWRLTLPLRFVIFNTKRALRSPRTALGRVRRFLVRHGLAFYRRRLSRTRIGQWLRAQILARGFITRDDLQIAQSAEDRPVTQETPIETAYSVPGFHLSQPLNFELRDELMTRPHINVLLPSLRLKHMSGGPNTALLMAALLAECGEYIRMFTCDAAAEGEEALLRPHIDGLLGRPAAHERIELVDSFDRTIPVAIGANDIFFATAWWTAQIAKYAIQLTIYKSFIYLIQDFEPILHEGSTFQARALETYGLVHIPIINTRLLRDHLVSQKAGCYADAEFADAALYFEPALDRTYYFPEPGPRNGKKTLLFYARPTSARRNLFEIGVVALREAVAAGAIDKDGWDVWAMGEKLEPVALGNGVFLNPLPWMSFEDYAKRVRTADLLLSLMLSPHPSYPPLEMAASGKLVVTNSFSVKTAEAMRAFSPNIIVAEPNAESIAAALASAAGRINAGLGSYDPLGAMALPGSWDESLADIVPALLTRISELREAPAKAGTRAIGFPAVPKTAYESYRRAALARRRADGAYTQKLGLLSFITTAYNTDPVFLDELAASLFQQDGGVNFEWLILDNGSASEATRQALQKIALHPGVRLERVEQNLGIIGGMRFCLEHAAGRYVLPLDSDDLIEPDCVHVLTRFIQERNYPPLIYTDEDKLDRGTFNNPYFKPGWDQVLFLHSCYIAHLCAIDREMALDLGVYTDKSAEGCHDWDSFIRFMDAGHAPLHVPEVLYSWRMHHGSTSGNIASKNFITESHRATLGRALAHRTAPNLELVSSPLFKFNVDWWFRRKRDVAVEYLPVTISGAQDTIAHFEQIVSSGVAPLVHLCWDGMTPDDDEWRWDAAGLLELFDDAVMVGGTLHDGSAVTGGPMVFGFGKGFGCPDRGRPLADPGYSAIMWKARSVSAVSSGHCVVRRDFLLEVLPILAAENVTPAMLGPWLGALAQQAGKRVVFSPFMRARCRNVPEDGAAEDARAQFLSRFWTNLPDTRFYSPRLGLTPETAYLPVSDAERASHLKRLQDHTLVYAAWLEHEVRERAARYQATQNVTLSIVTPVYQGSDFAMLDELAKAIAAQSLPAHEWLLIVNGPMKPAVLETIKDKAERAWNARVIVEPRQIGIVPALRLGLEAASGEYVIPVDGDDLITKDALQILECHIKHAEHPALLYSDEDLLAQGVPAHPYLRGRFDPVLSLENSTIWHLCAMRREVALAAGVYSDEAANWCQDWDSVSRIYSAGLKISHIPEVLYHWRQHAGSTTNNETGDARSLDSVRFVLERHISASATPERFEVAEWPESRGAKELYIARVNADLPPFVWIGDLPMARDVADDAILIFSGNDIVIDAAHAFVETARLLELHPHLGAVGGLVTGANGLVVDGCGIVNAAGALEWPWTGLPATHGGPYALALKPQTVSVTGAALAFFRVAALKASGLWPLNPGESAPVVCGRLAAAEWATAFSPLVRGRTSLAAQPEAPTVPPAGLADIGSGLVRYGMARNYRL